MADQLGEKPFLKKEALYLLTYMTKFGLKFRQ